MSRADWNGSARKKRELRTPGHEGPRRFDVMGSLASPDLPPVGIIDRSPITPTARIVFLVLGLHVTHSHQHDEVTANE